MKEITTKSGKLLLVKVPDNCLRIQTVDFPSWYLYDNIFDTELVILYGKSGTCEERIDIKHNYRDLRLLGKFSELKDNDFEEFVLQWGQDMNKDIINSVVLGFSDIIKVDENGLYYKDYLDNINNNYTLTVKESFESLVKSQGLDGDLDNYLIIKVL